VPISPRDIRDVPPRPASDDRGDREPWIADVALPLSRPRSIK
jgi:hypothetical protein